MAVSKKIAIIGSGIFGLAIAEQLSSKKYHIDIYEKEKKILLGASKNNLNRIHQGFHYPRSSKTIKQSSKNYLKFIKKYKKFIKKKQDSFYLIANKNSKTNLNKFIRITKKIPYFSKQIKLNKFPIKIKNVDGGIKTNELIYDWNLMEKYFLKIIKKNNLNLLLNTKVLKFNSKNILYSVNLNNKKKRSSYYDYIIDCSYIFQNHFKKALKLPLKKKIYQKTIILEVVFDNCPDIGVAIMDGNFISFLPKGYTNKFLIYDVKHSVLKKNINKIYPPSFNSPIPKKIKKISEKNILKNLNYFFPNLSVKKLVSYKISDRVFDISKNDQRLSKVQVYKDKIFFVEQGKTDHCIETASIILKKISQYEKKN